MYSSIRPLFLLVALLLLASSSFATPSDSVDVLHYDIAVDSLDWPNQEIYARTTVSLVPRFANTSQVSLDLLHLVVDTILVNNLSATWTYNDTLLRIGLPTTAGLSDTLQIAISYHGKPRKDPSSFGGFYFVNNPQYAYNIGVGFFADPHNYGRVWFPCKDNFPDKASYSYHIRVPDQLEAICGGSLQAVTPNGDGTQTWHWDMPQEISTYLASMAVADLVAVRDTFYSNSGDSIPISIWVPQNDSSQAVASFVNLQLALTDFETRLGTYRWDRIGYVGVPFNGGAMEHAGNIAYPFFAINGNLTWETLWAHELGHSWFGNLVTCEEAGEMWLNEGFAAYCEALFTEATYGPEAYKKYVRANHANVVRYTYISDGSYLAVSGVGHDDTYGSTVYDKGALVAHTLRYYLRDNDFFPGIQAYMNQYAFATAHSDTLKKVLETSSGQNLDSFFDGWVYQPGFPHFQVDSFSVVPTGQDWFVTVNLRQRRKGTGVYFDNVKADLTFYDTQWNKEVRSITFSGQTASLGFTLPIQPAACFFDAEEHLTDATIDNYHTFTAPGSHTFPDVYCTVDAGFVQDSALVRITHNWVGPDDFVTPPFGQRLGDSRYWKVEGLFPLSFSASATLDYSAQVSGNPGANPLAFLDHTWLNDSEDSLLLFYREGPWEDWTEHPSYTLNTGTLVDKKGTVTLNGLAPGEYALGIWDETLLGLEPETGERISIEIFPNPASETLTLDVGQPGEYEVDLSSIDGKITARYFFAPKNGSRDELNIRHLPPGLYLLRITDENGREGSQKVMIH